MSTLIKTILQPPPPSGDGALFFISAPLGLPPGAFLSIYGYNLPNPATVRVNGKSQTIENQKTNYTRLPLHPALMKLGKDSGVYNVDLTVDGGGEPTNSETYERIDVILDNVIVGDTSLSVDGIGLVTNYDGTYSLNNTISGFTIHAGTPRFVALTGSNGNPGTITQPWRTPEFAMDNASPGDAVYFRAGSWADTMPAPGGGSPVFMGIDTGRHGTEGLPIHYSAYPAEVVTTNADDFGFSEYGTGIYTDFEIHNFESIAPGNSGPGMFSVRAPTRLRRVSIVANYGQGLYAAAGAAGINVGGGVTTNFADGSFDFQAFGNYYDNTSVPGPTNNNAHVYYHPGRGWSQRLYFNHNRQTRHGSGRVFQLYGHYGGRFNDNGSPGSGEFVDELHVNFNNFEGTKQGGQQPAVVRYAAFDNPPGNNNWYDNVYTRWNSLSGGSTGLDMQGKPGSVVCSTLVNECDLIAEDNVCYNNSNDIQMTCYETTACRRNITEGAIQFDKEAPNGTTTIDENNTTDYPTALQ